MGLAEILVLVAVVVIPIWILKRIIGGIVRLIRGKRHPISRKKRRQWNKTRDRILKDIENSAKEREEWKKEQIAYKEARERAFEQANLKRR